MLVLLEFICFPYAIIISGLLGKSTCLSICAICASETDFLKTRRCLFVELAIGSGLSVRLVAKGRWLDVVCVSSLDDEVFCHWLDDRM